VRFVRILFRGGAVSQDVEAISSGKPRQTERRLRNESSAVPCVELASALVVEVTGWRLRDQAGRVDRPDLLDSSSPPRRYSWQILGEPQKGNF